MQEAWANYTFSEAWAARRTVILKAAMGEDGYEEMLGFALWSLGAGVADIVAGSGVQRSGFYYRLSQVRMKAWEAFRDGRETNGRRVAALTPEQAWQVAEWVVRRPGISLDEIVQDLARQNCPASRAQVEAYLERAQLHGYQPTVRPSTEVVERVPAGEFTRYAAQLLQVSRLEALGFYQVIRRLDVTGEMVCYSHLVRCQVVVMELLCGKTRLYHIGELVEDEFAMMLGCSGYPGWRDMHLYLDQIVAADEAQAESGVPPAKRQVERFVREARTHLAQAGGVGVGQMIYADVHVIGLRTSKAIGQSKHGVQARIVRALVKIRTCSAGGDESSAAHEQVGRPLTFSLHQGGETLVENVLEAVKLTEKTTGEAVEWVGADRGALSQTILEAFIARRTGLTIWGDNTPKVRQAVEALPRDQFVDWQYEPVRRADGKMVSRLRRRLADVPQMVINEQGFACRTVVVEDVQTGHRAPLHVVGQPLQTVSAQAIASFMLHKQFIEEGFKQDRRWGSDAFCGGAVHKELRREKPDAEEVQHLKVKARQLKERYQCNLEEESHAQQAWQTKQIPKRTLNDQRVGIRRRRARIESDWQRVEDLIRWGQSDCVPANQERWVVDTRKMQVMSQFQDFARVARQETMDEFKRSWQAAVVERAIARAETPVNAEQRHAMEREAANFSQRMAWGQVETRLFAQGGWVDKNVATRTVTVALKPFDNPLMQRACELLCEHLNQSEAKLHCDDENYQLRYSCLPAAPP